MGRKTKEDYKRRRIDDPLQVRKRKWCHVVLRRHG